MDEERKRLRDRLTDYNLSYTWLINIMRRKGVEVDKSTVSSVVNGTITGDRVTTIVTLGQQILDDYEKRFLSAV